MGILKGIIHLSIIAHNQLWGCLTAIHDFVERPAALWLAMQVILIERLKTPRVKGVFFVV